MIIKKANMPAFDVLKKDWHDYVTNNHAGDKFDPCFNVGYMPMSLTTAWKPFGCGFVIIVKENVLTIASTTFETSFAQAKDGIAWKIERIHGDSRKTIHSGNIRDTGILTDKPCPGLLAERMMKVSMAAIDIARVEQKLMHL